VSAHLSMQRRRAVEAGPIPRPAVDGTNRPMAILREQFSYLLEHEEAAAAAGCVADCAACTRLRRVIEILMEPFRSDSYSSRATPEL
jgi:hypothetical protein